MSSRLASCQTYYLAMYSNVNAFKSQRWPNGAPNGPKGPGWHPQGYVAAKPCAWPRLACASILKIQNSVHFGAKWPHAKTNLNYLEHPHGPEGGCSPSWQHAPRCTPSVFLFGPLLGHTAASKMEKIADNGCMGPRHNQCEPFGTHPWGLGGGSPLRHYPQRCLPSVL